jgi:hypothetical protein
MHIVFIIQIIYNNLSTQDEFTTFTSPQIISSQSVFTTSHMSI